jgi:hypothetical protein
LLVDEVLSCVPEGPAICKLCKLTELSMALLEPTECGVCRRSLADPVAMALISVCDIDEGDEIEGGIRQTLEKPSMKREEKEFNFN